MYVFLEQNIWLSFFLTLLGLLILGASYAQVTMKTYSESRENDEFGATFFVIVAITSVSGICLGVGLVLQMVNSISNWAG